MAKKRRKSRRKPRKSVASRIDDAFYGRAEKHSAMIGDYLKKSKR